ncbi:MAG: FAD-dependent oxidoreductase [Alphaproteobacteria bacterium]|nr:FAD-dependent oxidoreductase [Alphaproteobacteria bacterium]
MQERIIVAGAGIAGLGAAMALGREGREVLILERDPPPPHQSMEEAFYGWERKGATQLRHSHVFLGRLFSLIRDRHPRLLSLLLENGVREFTLKDGLPEPLRETYRPQKGDQDMSILFSRRTTLELVMRHYAQDLPGVRFLSSAAVRGLIADRKEGTLKIRGLRIEQDANPQEVLADVTIDASGRGTMMPIWLRELGCELHEEESPAGILYFTRHYRLKEGMEEPERGAIPFAGDLGYIKYGIFAADSRHFSLTLAVPEIETELRKVILSGPVFDRIAALIPGAGIWTSAERAEPVSKVYGMGNLVNSWRHYLKGTEPEVLNFFAIGDAAIRTNPLYGRGCSSGFVQAHILSDVLDETADPIARARMHAERVNREIRPHFNSMTKQDSAAIRRAINAKDPNYRPRFRARMIKSLTDDAIGPASRGDLTVFRALMRPFHMLESPDTALRNPEVIARLLWTWMKPKSWKQHLHAPVLGPERAQMHRLLGLAA